MSNIGLVTVLFNSNSVLEGFFKSLSLQIYKNYSLYLIDNTPSIETDNLINTLVERYPIAKYVHIKNSENYGVAKGNNQGIERSLKDGSTHTLLLNNDIEFDDINLLEYLYNYALKNKEALIIPKILFYDSRKVWMAGGVLDKFKGNTYHIGEGEDDGARFSKKAYYEYAPTCFMLIDNSVFKNVGMMDEKYFVYYDDTDFIFRCIQYGYKILLLPNLIIFHKVSSLTGGKESPFSIFYGTRNRIYFIKKNFKGLDYISSILFLFFSRIIRFVKFDKKQRNSLIAGVKSGISLKY